MSTCLPTHRFSTTRPHVLSHHSKSKQIILLPYPFIINLFTFVVRSLSLFSSSALLHYSYYYLVTITTSQTQSMSLNNSAMPSNLSYYLLLIITDEMKYLSTVEVVVSRNSVKKRLVLVKRLREYI